jgi:hypothetical protein
MKNSNHPTPSGNAALPSHDAICQRARDIWLSRGQPLGQDLDIWLEAERELRSSAPASRLDPEENDTAVVATPRGFRKKKLGGKTLSERVEESLPEGGYGTPGSAKVVEPGS